MSYISNIGSSQQSKTVYILIDKYLNTSFENKSDFVYEVGPFTSIESSNIKLISNYINLDTSDLFYDKPLSRGIIKNGKFENTILNFAEGDFNNKIISSYVVNRGKLEYVNFTPLGLFEDSCSLIGLDLESTSCNPNAYYSTSNLIEDTYNPPSVGECIEKTACHRKIYRNYLTSLSDPVYPKIPKKQYVEKGQTKFHDKNNSILTTYSSSKASVENLELNGPFLFFKYNLNISSSKFDLNNTYLPEDVKKNTIKSLLEEPSKQEIKIASNIVEYAGFNKNTVFFKSTSIANLISEIYKSNGLIDARVVYWSVRDNSNKLRRFKSIFLCSFPFSECVVNLTTGKHSCKN